MHNTIKIGTRESELAMWQANTVSEKLESIGYHTKIIPIKSKGDLNLEKPIYKFGIVGVFTKTLDIALLAGKIDIAVHSMKDVPTSLPQGITQGAVLSRTNPKDILIYNENLDFLNTTGTVATGSLRRKAQWLNRYPQHTVENLRGNVNTRLRKIKENQWNGGIFAAAGLERIGLLPEASITLDWMIPAPAQGALMVVAQEKDEFSLTALRILNDKRVYKETHIERQFLQALEGGCSAPIGALARLNEETQIINFHGILLSLDGSRKCEIKRAIAVEDWEKSGGDFAKDVLANGGEELMDEFRENQEK